MTAETVHLMRESLTRPLSFRLICGENQRETDGAWIFEDRGSDLAEVNCPSCCAIVGREAANSQSEPQP